MSQKLTQAEYRAIVQPTLPGTSHVSHSNLGKDFEAMLNRTHHFYAVNKLASVEKNPVEWRYIGFSEYNKLKTSRGELVAITNTNRYIKKVKSDVDYCGVFGGRFITFDAKQTKESSLPLGNIAEHQIQTLLSKERAGGISGLMIYFSEKGRCFFVPASIVDAANIEMLYKKGRKSLSVDLCAAKGREIPVTHNLVDWLKVLIEEV